MEHIIHPIPPLYDEQSRILILGSFPSVKSREAQFFYGHPQNRFWKVLAAVLGCPVPQTVPEKSKLLHENHIALWDVIASCDIEGSSDSSIKNVVAADIVGLMKQTQIKRIYANGKTAGSLYEKFVQEKTEMGIVVLPSTSPANAAYSLERLIQSWKDV